MGKSSSSRGGARRMYPIATRVYGLIVDENVC